MFKHEEITISTASLLVEASHCFEKAGHVGEACRSLAGRTIGACEHSMLDALVRRYEGLVLRGHIALQKAWASREGVPMQV